MTDIAVRAAGAILIGMAYLLGRAQDDIKLRSLTDDPGLVEWLVTIGCVGGLCGGVLILLSGASLFNSPQAQIPPYRPR